MLQVFLTVLHVKVGEDASSQNPPQVLSPLQRLEQAVVTPAKAKVLELSKIWEWYPVPKMEGYVGCKLTIGLVRMV